MRATTRPWLGRPACGAALAGALAAATASLAIGAAATGADGARSSAAHDDLSACHGKPDCILAAVSTCRRDADCILSSFDCSECGPCPGFPPQAVTRRQLEWLEEECRRNPPWRLAPDPGHAHRTPVACSPCPDTGDHLIREYKAVCKGSRCAAELVSARPVPLPGPNDPLPAPGGR
jgi:hypothetical protein